MTKSAAGLLLLLCAAGCRGNGTESSGPVYVPPNQTGDKAGASGSGGAMSAPAPVSPPPVDPATGSGGAGMNPAPDPSPGDPAPTGGGGPVVDADVPEAAAAAAICMPTGTIPPDVEAVLKNRCQNCHGTRPLPGVGGPLTTYEDFLRASEVDPTRNVGRTALARTKDMNTPMPPPPGAPLDATESATLARWIESTVVGCKPEPGSVIVRGDGGATGPLPEIYTHPTTCSRGVTWNAGGGDDNGSSLMDPGQACVACHKKGEAPRFDVGGTIYATAHEPNNCYGVDGKTAAAGAQVVVIDNNGKSVTLPVNAAGNFYVGSKAGLVPPLRAKVVYMGRERIMIRDVPDGDCNACHNEAGTQKALGRLIMP